MKENGISVYSCEITALYLEFTHFTQLDAEIPTANGPIVELRKNMQALLSFLPKRRDTIELIFLILGMWFFESILLTNSFSEHTTEHFVGRSMHLQLDMKQPSVN